MSAEIWKAHHTLRRHCRGLSPSQAAVQFAQELNTRAHICSKLFHWPWDFRQGTLLSLSPASRIWRWEVCSPPASCMPGAGWVQGVPRSTQHSAYLWPTKARQHSCDWPGDPSDCLVGISDTHTS